MSVNNKTNNHEITNNATNNTTLLLVSFTEPEKETENNCNHVHRPRLFEEVPADRVVSEVAIDRKRDQWSNKLEYMLSVIGYVVDLGSVLEF